MQLHLNDVLTKRQKIDTLLGRVEKSRIFEHIAGKESAMRPTYENDASREDEETAIKQVVDKWDCEAYKLPVSYRADYALVRKGIVMAFAEVKTRKATSTYFESYMLSLSKYNALCEISRNVGTKSLLIVKWSDRVTFATIPCGDVKVRMGGRTDRGDAADIEPVVYIPITEFTPI